MMPLIDCGLVTLFPDPCNFDIHLRDQMLRMATLRSRGAESDPKEETGLFELMQEDHKRSMLLMPREALRSRVQRQSPELDDAAVEAVLRNFDRYRELDPLSVLQEGSLDGGPDGGQIIQIKMAPNFEVTMYLAQATGSCIVTDSVGRWCELVAASRRSVQAKLPLYQLRATMEQADFVILHDPEEIVALAGQGMFEGYPDLMRKVFKYLSVCPTRGPKPNVEASLHAKFKRVHNSARTSAKRSGAYFSEARVSCLWPAGGIQDNNVNRLLLMSSSEHHLGSAPMALFLKSNVTDGD